MQHEQQLTHTYTLEYTHMQPHSIPKQTQLNKSHETSFFFCTKILARQHLFGNKILVETSKFHPDSVPYDTNVYPFPYLLTTSIQFL